MRIITKKIMAGEGFMMNAIQSLKFNKAQRRSQKLDWKDYVGQEKVPGRDPIKATPELLEEIVITSYSIHYTKLYDASNNNSLGKLFTV